MVILLHRSLVRSLGKTVRLPQVSDRGVLGRLVLAPKIVRDLRTYRSKVKAIMLRTL